MVTTNDPNLAKRVNMLRNHGATISEEQRHHGPKPYLMPDFPVMGFNYRMTDMQAAVGIVQLGKLDRLINEREHYAAFYNQQLAEVFWLQTPQAPSGYKHGWQAYVCYVNEDLAPAPRNDLMEILQNKGIHTRPGTHAIHMLSYYRERFGYSPEDFPVSRDCAEKTIALPLHNQMTPDDYDYVVQILKGL